METLIEHRVKFVVVGGQAAEWHGAQRPTADTDVVVDHELDNLQRVSAALNELNWRYRYQDVTDEEAKALAAVPMHPTMLHGHPIQTLMTDAGPLDILRVIPTIEGETPGRDYTALADAAHDHQLFPGLVVKLAALDHIIESKTWADRPKDREALDELIDLQRKYRTQP